MKPEDLIEALTERPLLTQEDIADAQKHSADWQRQVVLLVRKRAAERISEHVTDLMRAAEGIINAGS